MKTWFSAFFSLLLPRTCVVCSDALIPSEACICTQCNILLPRTQYHLKRENPVENRFLGLLPIEKATSYFFYVEESNFRHIIHQLKYKGQKQIGEQMGRQMATDIQKSGFFNDIDIIVPVPLHAKKLKSRGYNQSEWLAQGIALITRLPVVADALIRKTNTDSQTTKTRFERWDNMQDVFFVHQPELYAGKHILLVDDVLTTGATIVASAKAFANVKDVRFSIITLGIATR